MPVEVTSLSREVTVATWRDVLLVHFRGTTPASCVADLRKARSALPATGRFVFFGVIEEASDPPDQDARRALSKFFSDNAASISVCAVTYKGGGFRGAIVRTIVSSVIDLMPGFRLGFPKYVLGSVDEAARMAHRHDARVDPTALLAAFRDLAAMKP